MKKNMDFLNKLTGFQFTLDVNAPRGKNSNICLNQGNITILNCYNLKYVH